MTSRFAKLRLVTSPNHLYKKLEEYGADHDAVVKEMVGNDCKRLASQKKHDLSIEANDAQPSVGFKLTVDNVDYTQNVHYMTENHQNKDRHDVSINATANRVSANHLSDNGPTCSMDQLENGKCIPSHIKQKAQRQNYITLVKRVIVDNVPCLAFGKELVEKHIPHQYMKETAEPTKSVSIIIFVVGFPLQ